MTAPGWTTSRLRAPVPEGWSVTESWVLRSPDGRVDVGVEREPLPPDVGTERYAQAQGDRLATDLPQYRQHVLTVLPLASGPAYARLFSWAPPAGPPVVRVQVYATVPGTGFTATATAPAAARPISVSTGMLTTASAVSATSTVSPAKVTAEPAVPTARPAASTPVRPSASSCRYRETMNSA